MKSPHIFHEIDDSLATLKDKVLLMAGLTRQNLERAIQSLLHFDIDLARMVIGDDSDVDDLEVKIDQLGMDILCRFQPVATDLRLVITSMKTAHNLERISDHATNIAKLAKKICKSSDRPDATIIEPIFAIASKILSDALLAYTNADTRIGESLRSCDKQLDTAHKEVVAMLGSRLEGSGSRAVNLLHLILVARSLERVGDLAVNIGEDSVFLGEARDIRHEHRRTAHPDGGAV